MNTKIKIKVLIFLVLQCVLLGACEASQKVFIERYEDWKHPVLKVFQQYGVAVYKVSYSKDGKCPTFYAKFKHTPDPRDPDAANFYKVYYATLKANSYFPYALVDEVDDMRINVGWEDKARTKMKVDLDAADTISRCRNG